MSILIFYFYIKHAFEIKVFQTCWLFLLYVVFFNLILHVTDELDSYMYQTVGHQAIDLYAEAMDLPLYRRTIQGSSLDTSKNYTKTDGDEVEDLYDLLHLVKVCVL